MEKARWEGARGGEVGRGAARNGRCKMAISCQRGVKCVCQGSGGCSNAEIIVSEPRDRGGSGSERGRGRAEDHHGPTQEGSPGPGGQRRVAQLRERGGGQEVME